MKVYVRHIRGAKLCTQGARRWFAQKELSWTDFLENGLDAEIVRALGDPFADRALAAAEAEESEQ
jgi:hypothetical protein